MTTDTPTDTLKGSREHVMANLTSIRVGKTKLLKMLSNLKEMEDNGNVVDKSMVAKLVESYDALSKQEENYIQVIRDIIQQRVVRYANEANKAKAESAADDETGTAEDIMKEVDEIERDAIAASAKHDLIVSALRERLEKKKLLDQIHQAEDPQEDTRNNLVKQLELTKLQLANEKESLDRVEEMRNRLRRKAIKRGYLLPQDAGSADVQVVKEPEIGPDERVPPLADSQLPPQSLEKLPKEEVHAKIQRHIDQIKARKQRMSECYMQAQEMLSLKKTYDDSIKRLHELESVQQHLQELKMENEKKAEE